MNMNNNLKNIIDRIYETFEKYRKPDLKNLSCVDFEMTEEDFIHFDQISLNRIQEKEICKLEFYGYGWDEWGTEAEVKYFLPRIFECLALKNVSWEGPTIHSLFKYKLCNLYNWPDDEKIAVLHFLKAWFSIISKENSDITEAIQLICYVDQINPYLSEWNKIDQSLKEKQIANLLESWILDNNSHEYFTIKSGIKKDKTLQIMHWILSDDHAMRMKIFQMDKYYSLLIKSMKLYNDHDQY